jgi:hypothetical protein
LITSKIDVKRANIVDTNILKTFEQGGERIRIGRVPIAKKPHLSAFFQLISCSLASLVKFLRLISQMNHQPNKTPGNLG